MEIVFAEYMTPSGGALSLTSISYVPPKLQPLGLAVDGYRFLYVACSMRYRCLSDAATVPKTIKADSPQML